MYYGEQSEGGEELEKLPVNDAENNEVNEVNEVNNVKYLLLTAKGKKKDVMRVIIGGTIL